MKSESFIRRVRLFLFVGTVKKKCHLGRRTHTQRPACPLLLFSPFFISISSDARSLND